MRGADFFKEMLSRPPFSKLHPQVAAFFKDYLSREKVVTFDGSYVVNTHFRPIRARPLTRWQRNSTPLEKKGNTVCFR